jgi:dihydrofolate synthase/folylpolyglutamate synthase
MIPPEDVARGLDRLRQCVREWDPHPTFFELTTALALKHFSEAKCSIIVLETGLGGRLDATNAVSSSVSVITPIGLDHQNWLGQTIREIADEKAGIIKPKVPVISAQQPRDAEEVICLRAAECEAPLRFIDQPYDASPVALRGTHQKENAAVAVSAIRGAGIDVTESAIARGLASVEWPARFQYWDERTIIDGAHNRAAAAVLARTWRENFCDTRATLVLAVLSDKNAADICQELAPISEFVFLPQIRSGRALPPAHLARTLSNITPLLHYSIVSSVAEALQKARVRSAPILLTGSLHFAGEALAHLRGDPAAFEECAQ